MKWSVEEIPTLQGYTVEWAAPGEYFLSRRNELFFSPTLEPPFEKIATIRGSRVRELLSRSRLAQRLLRFQVTNVIPMDEDEIFVTFDKSAGVVSGWQYRPLEGMVRPCRVLRGACAVDAEGSLFFGEYLNNAERGEVHVYTIPKGSQKIEVAHTFSRGSIRHVHGIYFDPFTEDLFCLTGDVGDECRILRTTDRFATLETVGMGNESWRAVSMIFTAESMIFGTDAEHSENRIFRIDRATGERMDCGSVDGTVFYSVSLGEDHFFTTTAENAPGQRLDRAGLWHLGPEHTLELITDFPKDRWNHTLFQFGTIHFPSRSTLDHETYFHLVGVKGDNRCYRVKRGRSSPDP